MAGFGVLTKYIIDTEVEEININSWNCIEVIYPDRVEMLSETFINADDCMDKIKKMVWLGGSIIDGSNPKVDSFIGEGIRISAIIPPCVDKKTGGVASIRRQKENVISRELMINYGSATDDELDFLSLCVNNGVSLAIAGSTGSGKTTDLGYLLKSIDRNKRIYTIEDTRELNIADVNESGRMINRVIQTVTKDGVNPVTMDDLLKEALRFHPYTIIPAEMRGKEALTAVEAGRTGHIIISTLHANSAIDAYIQQAKSVRKLHIDGTFNEKNLDSIFVEEEKVEKFYLDLKRLKSYFPNGCTTQQCEDALWEMLDRMGK